MESQSTSPVVEFDALTVRYGAMTAVDHLTTAIGQGQVYAFLGRNGAGKTSLLRCLLGIQKPQDGRVRAFGRDTWTGRHDLMARIGVVPEEPDAPPDMTTRQIVRFCSRLYPRWNEASVNERIRRSGADVTTPFGRLSKGQKRQILLALALAHGPEILILDDPTLGLDVVARKELFEELIADLADRGTSVIITTHDLSGIEGIADRIGILRNGSLVLDEEVERLKSRFRRIRYGTPAASSIEGDLLSLKAVGLRRWGGGMEAILTNYDELAMERFRTSSGVREVEISPMSLEEIFIAVAGDQGGQQ